MEALLQELQEPFTISCDHLSEDPTCPFCGAGLVSLDDQGLLVCQNECCPYVRDSAIYDVTNALIEVGRHPLTAAQLAVTYASDSRPDEITVDRFTITDEIKANWVLKQMAEANSRIAAAQQMIDAEIDAIRKRGEEILKPHRDRIQFFTAAFGSNLAEWTRDQLEGSKSKSIKLLHGNVGFRKAADTFVVDDEEKALQWAVDNDCDSAVKVELKKSEFKKHFTASIDDHPELKDIAHIDVGVDEFFVKPESPVH